MEDAHLLAQTMKPETTTRAQRGNRSQTASKCEFSEVVSIHQRKQPGVMHFATI